MSTLVVMLPGVADEVMDVSNDVGCDADRCV